MPLRIEDYAVIGNCETAALVGRDGSIDWLCLPRFDSSACFCALLGGPEHGRWLIAPIQNEAKITRQYLSDTLILETVFTTAGGSVSLTDFMYRRDGSSELVRIVRGLQGEVPMRTELVVRFDYGADRAVGVSAAGRAASIHCRPGQSAARYERSDARRGSSHDRRLLRPRGRRGKLRAQLVAVVSRGCFRRSQRTRSSRRANKSIRSGPDGRRLSSRLSPGATSFFARF